MSQCSCKNIMSQIWQWLRIFHLLNFLQNGNWTCTMLVYACCIPFFDLKNLLTNTPCGHESAAMKSSIAWYISAELTVMETWKDEYRDSYFDFSGLHSTSTTLTSHWQWHNYVVSPLYCKAVSDYDSVKVDSTFYSLYPNISAVFRSFLLCTCLLETVIELRLPNIVLYTEWQHFRPSLHALAKHRVNYAQTGTVSWLGGGRDTRSAAKNEVMEGIWFQHDLWQVTSLAT